MKRVLKKVTAALLAATMVVGLAACGNGGSSDDKSSKSSKSGKVKIGVSIFLCVLTVLSDIIVNKK